MTYVNAWSLRLALNTAAIFYKYLKCHILIERIFVVKNGDILTITLNQTISFFMMSLLMILFTIWRWGTSLSQVMIMKPTKTSKSKILRNIKTHTIKACWLECQQTSGCVAIGTDSDNEKINDLVFDCYILNSLENKPQSSNETPLSVIEISLFTVSYF